MPKSKTLSKPSVPANKKTGGDCPGSSCSASVLADRIANEILTVGASGKPIRCNRAVMMKGKYPDGERNMGGRNHASIAMVIREHLLAAGFPPNANCAATGSGRNDHE
jgi:hypothetical protein